MGLCLQALKCRYPVKSLYLEYKSNKMDVNTCRLMIKCKQ